MKKFWALCLSAVLILPTSPIVFAASGDTPITVNVIYNKQNLNGQDQIVSPGRPATIKYKSIAEAMKDLSDGKVVDKRKVECTLDSTKPCTIDIDQDLHSAAYAEEISEKVIISANSTKIVDTSEEQDSEIILPFKEVEIAVPYSIPNKESSITFSGGLEVQDGASLILDNNKENKNGASITYSFGAPVTVYGSLKFEGNMQQLGNDGGTNGSVKFTNGANLTVNEGGQVTAASVAITGGDTESPLIKVNEGGKLDFVTAGVNSYGTIETPGTAIQVDGGEVKIDAGKIKSTGGTAIVANKGNVEVKKSSEEEVTKPEISSTGQSAIKVEQGAALVLPQSADAKITTQNSNGKAVDLANGSKVEIAETTVTVGTDGENYVGNNGIAYLDAGAKDEKNQALNHAVLLPDGTIVQGTANKKPTVDTNDDGSIKVTVPEGGSVTEPNGTTTNMPNGGNVSTDGNDTTVTPEIVPSGGGGGGSTQKLNKVYRAYNPNNGEHLYTLDEKEFKHVTSLGWHDEGVAFMAETEKNGQALYRVYNPNSGLHHYTTDENEKNTLVSLGWNEEGIAWYASNKPQSAPVYRVYNPNDGQHHYTVDGHEKDVLVSLGWTYEGIAFKTAPIEK